MNIQLPETVERRLKTLARITKRSTNYYVRVAVLNHLDDLEDVAMAERTLSRIDKGEKTIPLEEVMKRHRVTATSALRRKR